MLCTLEWVNTGLAQALDFTTERVDSFLREIVSIAVLPAIRGVVGGVFKGRRARGFCSASPCSLAAPFLCRRPRLEKREKARVPSVKQRRFQ